MPAANVGAVWRRWRTAAALLTVAALIAVLGGCSRANREERRTAPAAADYAQSLREKVTTDEMFAHLQHLQEIADANGGNRAIGTPGYDASLDYVVKTLRDSGFDVQTPEFDFRKFEPGPVSLTVNGAPVPAQVLEYSIGTGPAGVSGPLVAAPGPPQDETPGCQASDYDGLPVSGAVVLVDRGYCQFSIKEAAAVAARCGGDDRRGQRRRREDERHARRAHRRQDPGDRRQQGRRGEVESPAGPRRDQGRRQGDKHQGAQRDCADQDRLRAERGGCGSAPGLRAGGSRHQRQRLRRGGGARNRDADGQFAADSERRPVRVLGRRGGRAGRAR